MLQISWTTFLWLVFLFSAIWLAPKVLYELLACYYIEKLNRWLERRGNGNLEDIDGSPVFLFAAGFAGGHPIKKLFCEESQNTLVALAALLVDERLPNSSIAEKQTYFHGQIANWGFVARWFWSHR